MELRILPEDFKLVSDPSLQKAYVVHIQVRDVTVGINDHKTSDTFTAEIDYKNFPFDPRSIRACGVKIHMEDMKSLYTRDGALNTIVPTPENAVFAGFVDEDSVTFNESSRKVRLEGRDFSCLLIDQKYKELSPISHTDPIDVTIKNFLKGFPATREIVLVNRTGKSTLPTLAEFYPDFDNPLAPSKNVGAHESYWDIIQGIVNKAGLIAYFNLDQLIITTPRNLYDEDGDLNIIYGKNVKELTWKRKLGRFRNFNILVRSRVEKNVVEAEIPLEAEEEWCKSFGIPKERVKVPVLKPDGTVDSTTAGKQAPMIAFPVPGIANKEALIKIGQSVFEDYSRQQIEGTIETREMVGHAGVDRNDPNWLAYDLTKLDIGQPLCIELAIDDISMISDLATEAQRVTYLKKRGYAIEIASIFAKTMGRFSPRFFTKGYTLNLKEDGFSLKIDFINIIQLSNVGLTGGPR